MQIYCNKKILYTTKEFNSDKIGLEHQHGRRFIVFGYQYGWCDVMWKHSMRYRQSLCRAKWSIPPQLTKVSWRDAKRSTSSSLASRNISRPSQGYPQLNYFSTHFYYSTFIHCTNSDFLIGWFVPRDTGLWRNNLLEVIIVPLHHSGFNAVFLCAMYSIRIIKMLTHSVLVNCRDLPVLVH